MFTVAAASGSTIDMDSFNVGFINPKGKVTGGSPVGAKFVVCTGLDCVAPDDSAFGGGVVPEPATGTLFLLGFAALAASGRHQRRDHGSDLLAVLVVP